MSQIADPLHEASPVSSAAPCRSIPLVPLAPGTRAKPNTPERTQRDLRTLTTFVSTFCKAKHKLREPFDFNALNIPKITEKPVLLCSECTKLLQHALVKRTHCRRDPKPECKHCPAHCYAPRYRAQIRQVMMFSGKRLLLRGRIDYLWHLFF